MLLAARAAVFVLSEAVINLVMAFTLNVRDPSSPTSGRGRRAPRGGIALTLCRVLGRQRREAPSCQKVIRTIGLQSREPLRRAGVPPDIIDDGSRPWSASRYLIWGSIVVFIYVKPHDCNARRRRA
jgi:hypothetical protein